jgi:hypothetical protein
MEGRCFRGMVFGSSLNGFSAGLCHSNLKDVEISLDTSGYTEFCV